MQVRGSILMSVRVPPDRKSNFRLPTALLFWPDRMDELMAQAPIHESLGWIPLIFSTLIDVNMDIRVAETALEVLPTLRVTWLNYFPISPNRNNGRTARGMAPSMLCCEQVREWVSGSAAKTRCRRLQAPARKMIFYLTPDL